MSIAAPVGGEVRVRKTATRTFIAGAPGTPGRAGQPGVPGHYISVVVSAPSTYGLPPGWGYKLFNYPPDSANFGQPPFLVPWPPGGFSGRDSGTSLLQPGQSYTVQIYVPPVAPFAGYPATPAIPSQMIIENNIGWNVAETSDALVAGAGQFSFYAPLTLVGAVVGIGTGSSVDYTVLTHALYLARGLVQVCESGTLLGTSYPYLDTDKLAISIDAAGRVDYQKNGVTFYRSTTLAPALVRLTACLYVANDAIYDLASQEGFDSARSRVAPMTSFGLDHGKDFVNTVVRPLTGSSASSPNRASASISLPTLRGFGLDIGYNFVTSALRAISSVSNSFGRRAQSIMQPIGGYSADAPYGFANSSMPAIQVMTSSGGIRPQYGVAESVVAPFYGDGESFLYQRLSGGSTIKALAGIGATDAKYAYSVANFRPLIGQTFSLPPHYALVMSALMGQDSMVLTQHLISGVINRGNASFTFVGTITLPQSMAEQALVSDYFTITDKLFRSIMSTVHAVAGTSSALTMALRMLATIGATASASDTMTLHQAIYMMMAERVKLYGLRNDESFDPEGLVGFQAPNGQTWVVNLEGNKPSSRYEGFDFNSFACINGQYFGARADGIYALEGDTDDGEPIRASVDFGNLNFGNLGFKRPTNAYIGVSSSGALVLKVAVEGAEYLYVARQADATMATQRFDFGKGLSGNYLNFELFNGSGEDFNLESIEFMVVPLSRRVVR